MENKWSKPTHALKKFFFYVQIKYIYATGFISLKLDLASAQSNLIRSFLNIFIFPLFVFIKSKNIGQQLLKTIDYPLIYDIVLFSHKFTQVSIDCFEPPKFNNLFRLFHFISQALFSKTNISFWVCVTYPHKCNNGE